MAELKTKANKASVEKFISSVDDEGRREDCRTLMKIMKKATKADPVMWGDSIVGFGTYHYVYESGREGDWFMVGFSPRKKNFSIYLMGGLEHQSEHLAKLGKHKTGKGCLYVNRLSDINVDVLTSMVQSAVEKLKKN
ncbi:DUF1801 domain-containing protein [bacterium]|nr:DUF1801 domain-containing protein [bacterium]